MALKFKERRKGETMSKEKRDFQGLFPAMVALIALAVTIGMTYLVIVSPFLWFIELFL